MKTERRVRLDWGIAPFLLLTVLTNSSAFSQAAGMGGRIMGQVLSDINIPPYQKGAQILLHAEPTGRSRTATIFSRRATSGPKGEFAFSGLPAGAYRLCVHLPASKLLDSCSSGGSGFLISLRLNQMIDGVLLPMKQGFELPVRVEDPGGYLEKHEGKTKDAYLAVGVQMGNGPLIPARLARKDRERRDYTVVVPFDSEVNVIAGSRFYTLEDDKGAAIAKGGRRFRVTVKRTDIDKSVAIRVTGGK